MSVIVFLQKFNSTCDEARVHWGAAMCPFKQFSTIPDEAAVKAGKTLMNFANFYRGGGLQSYCAVVQSLFKPYVTVENIDKLDAKVGSVTQRSVTTAEYAQ